MKKQQRFALNTGKLILLTVSFFVAVIAWIFVNSGQRVQKKRSVRIQYVQMPSGLSFKRRPPQEFKVDIKGSTYQLRKLKEEELTYLVDLSGARAGQNRVEIEIDSLRLSPEVEVSFPSPRSFVVHLEQIFTRDIPVRPVYLGQLKEGFQLGRVKMSPEALSVTGPQSVISKMDHVDVEVPLLGRDTSFTLNTKPKVNFPDTEALDPVSVEVEVVPQTLTKDFPNVPVRSDGRHVVTITPSVASVSVQGTQKDMGALSTNLFVTVSVQGLKPGRYRIRGSIDLPSGLKLIGIEPRFFVVEVRRW